jgi:hypothetical protein
MIYLGAANRVIICLYSTILIKLMNKRLCFGIIVMITLGSTATAIIANFSTQFVAAFINSDPDPRKAPIAITGDNVYVTW